MTADQITECFATQERIAKKRFDVQGVGGTVMLNPDLTDIEIIHSVFIALQKFEGELTIKSAIESALVEAETEQVTELDEAVKALLSGDAVIVFDGEENAIKVNCKMWDKRAIMEPPTETVTKGPREGFIEDIKTNISLLSRRLKSADFAIKRYNVGRCTDTVVAVCYMANIADDDTVQEVIDKITSIDIDGIIDSNYITSFLQKHTLSLFDEVGTAEKPDIVAAKLLEGRIAIVVDGSPIVLTVPHIVWEDFQSANDYYQKSAFVGFLRLLRIVGAMFAVLLPGAYVALQNFHYTLSPLKFMITLLNSIKGVPLPPTAETFFVIVLFEIIRESSVRMPRAVGMAMSIVGALVLGETAVNAGIVSSPAVMIVALSSISLYVAPNLVGSMSIMRLAFTFLGGLMGIYGLGIGLLYVAHYLARQTQYGAPLTAPFAPFIADDQKDGLRRAPIKELNYRPYSLKHKNPKRQSK